MGPGHGWRGAAAPVLRAGRQAPRQGRQQPSSYKQTVQEDGTEKGLLRAVSSHADAARMAGMPRGGLRMPSTCKTWRATSPSERKADGHASKGRVGKDLRSPPRLTKTGSADGGPRVYATTRSTTTLSRWGSKNRCGKDLRPPPSAPQDWGADGGPRSAPPKIRSTCGAQSGAFVER